MRVVRVAVAVLTVAVLTVAMLLAAAATRIPDGDATTTGVNGASWTPVPSAAPMITIFDGAAGGEWDGRPLSFGAVGLAQPDLNILGRVVGTVALSSVTYTVNGGAPVTLSLGSSDCSVGASCNPRLTRRGDFNADIETSLLLDGLNAVTIQAADTDGRVARVDVPVHYTSNSAWPLPYTVDWSSVQQLHDVAQPVDGRWFLGDSALEIDEIGYDRLIAFGDESWSSFEAEVPVTVNRVDHADLRGEPSVGFIVHWNGHAQVEEAQPDTGFRDRFGAIVWYRIGRHLEIRNGKSIPVGQVKRSLEPGVTYVFKMQTTVSIDGAGQTYRFKVFPQGSPEPASWDIERTLRPASQQRGSLLLVAHHVDVAFGNLHVREV